MNKKTPQAIRENLPEKLSAISKNELIREQITSKATIRTLEDMEPIKQSLRYIFVLIGLKPDQIPDDIQKAVLLDYIKNKLANYTPEDLKIAFQMAVNNEFESELNHFGLFSPKYLSRVFNKYLEHRNAIAKKVFEEKSRKDQELEEKRRLSDPKVQEQIRKEFDEVVLEPSFNQFKETKKLDFGAVPVEFVYLNLKNRGLILLSKEEEEQIKKEATKRTASEVNHFKSRFSINKKEIELRKLLRDPKTSEKTSKDIFFENCRKIAIEKLFSNLKTFQDVYL